MNDDDFDFTPPPEFLNMLSELDDTFLELPDFEEDGGFVNCPFLPLRDVVLFPQLVTPLFIARDRSLAAIEAALKREEHLVVAAQRDSTVTDPGAGDIFTIGTEVMIGRSLQMPDGTTSALAQGRRRVEIVAFTQWEPYIRVRARPLYEAVEWRSNTDALMGAVTNLFRKVADLNRGLPEDAYTFALNIDEPGWLADFVAAALNIALIERQQILEIGDPTDRLQRVSLLLARQLNMLELEDEIQSQVQQEVERSHREHFLREQMRVIQGELGEMDVFTQDIHELREGLSHKQLPEAVKAKAEKELARLTAMPPMSPEVGIIRTYIDWILELPWIEESEDNLDVTHASDVLEGDHYGLEQVKDRILEYIAVKKIAADKMPSPILCFVGPPGTGKTSLAQSIAKAIGREFVRLSLGGVRDEAEIRGHRRTYIGAMPGRIIQAMRRLKTRNPMFILDEVDKLGKDFRGDPSAALLEVLDPEQNDSFVDHYLDLDFDLSKVLFITTANFLDDIPPALRDRMEVIEFSGYLEEEKLEIARQFLLPKQVEAHGLDSVNIRFEEPALKTLIRRYTREAGVRNLEREVATVCRKIARLVAEENPFPPLVTTEYIQELLGPPKYSHEIVSERDEIGVATGAAWTAAGGAIMFIEVNLMPGKGQLTLTGKLGDVMRESAHAALSYTRSHSHKLGIADDTFEKTDIHLHIPEGAVPKDGPSAGVTLITALVSAFTRRPVRRDVCMTGEITLRGRVLAVGGIREKALAARRAGIKTFILPQQNENDLQLIPDKLRQDINFILVERVGEVLQQVLV